MRGDETEKSQQVMMMKNIYMNASIVDIWLGTLLGREQEALTRQFRQVPGNPLPPDLRSLDALRGSLRNNPDVLRRSESEYYERALRDKGEVMYEVTSKSWWQPVWVVQELCFAERAALVCGDSLIWWEEFEENLKWIMEKANRFGLSKTIWTEPTIQAAAEPCNFRSRYRSTTTPDQKWGLLQVLYTFRHYKATEDRDKIFGLLGLVTVEADLGFDPDYSQPVSKTYARLVKHVIAANKNLDILACAWPASSWPDLPSWAPDWTVATPAGYTPLRSQSLGLGDTRFSAGGSTRSPDVSFFNEWDKMHVAGIMLDTVSEVHNDVGDSTVEPICRWHERVLRKPGQMSATNTGPHTDKAREFFFTIVADTSVNGTVDTSYITTLQDRFAGKEPGKSPKKRWTGRQGLVFKRMDFEYPSRTDHVLDNLAKEKEKTIKPWIEKQEETFWEDVIRATRMRRVVHSRCGRMGLAPIEGQVGDKVFIPFGGKVPLVIRAVACGHKLIGQCYVYGVMNGEALRDGDEVNSKTETITLY